MTKEYKDGVYFDMPFDEYLALPRLSSHAIVKLNRSAAGFWAGSWFNKDKYEVTSKAFNMGKAYHVRMLEGKEAFLSQYASDQDESAFDGAYKTVADIKGKIEEYDNKPKGTKKADLAGQLLALEPSATFVDDIKAEYAKEHEGKIFVNCNMFNDIMRSADAFEKSEHGDTFKGGASEVTVLWHDKVTNLPMRARFDYLKPNDVPDLKTFSDQGREVKDGITGQIAMYRYHVQIAVYHEARIVARDLPQFGGSMDLSGDFTQSLIFQETGQANITRVVNFSTDLMMFQKGQDLMREAIDSFVEKYEKYADKRWDDDEKVIDLTDEDFPIWAYN